jgi:hypothetical protein
MLFTHHQEGLCVLIIYFQSGADVGVGTNIVVLYSIGYLCVTCVSSLKCLYRSCLHQRCVIQCLLLPSPSAPVVFHVCICMRRCYVVLLYFVFFQCIRSCSRWVIMCVWVLHILVGCSVYFRGFTWSQVPCVYWHIYCITVSVLRAKYVALLRYRSYDRSK